VPHYDFLCQSCKRLFSKTLTLSEYEQAVLNCPFCGTDEVAQGRWIAFHSCVPARVPQHS
jgi:putative FmdB family regulatory protein